MPDYTDRFNASMATFTTQFFESCEQLALCESPIEYMMLVALFFIGRIHHGSNFRYQCQYELAGYRVDFLISLSVPGSGSAHVIVECDGHEFHEKTKTQASRDKKRDRELQKAGYNVFRFSGADIWKDAIECAEEVLVFLADTLSEQARKENRNDA